MSYAGEILKLFFILGILLGVMYLLLYFVRKYLYAFDKNISGKIKINVISTQGLAPKKMVSAVKIKDKIYILGVCDNSITLLDKLDCDETELNSAEEKISGGSFIEILKKNLRVK